MKVDVMFRCDLCTELYMVESLYINGPPNDRAALQRAFNDYGKREHVESSHFCRNGQIGYSRFAGFMPPS